MALQRRLLALIRESGWRRRPGVCAKTRRSRQLARQMIPSASADRQEVSVHLLPSRKVQRRINPVLSVASDSPTTDRVAAMIVRAASAKVLCGRVLFAALRRGLRSAADDDPDVVTAIGGASASRFNPALTAPRRHRYGAIRQHSRTGHLDANRPVAA